MITSNFRICVFVIYDYLLFQCVSPGLVETEFAIRAIGEEAGKEMYRQRPVSTSRPMQFQGHQS